MSVLSNLPGFDCVWGFPLDYMHGVLLGVSKQLWRFWKTTYLSVKDKELIDNHLLNIKPPTEIHRVPRTIKNQEAWKATEWRSWLLFYSVPVLTSILHNELLESYKLLVKSINQLLSKKLTDEILLACEIDILYFLCDCQRIYGDSFMTFNVHSLRHVVESVRKNGLLSNNSAFTFESHIYNLKKKCN